MTLYMIGIGLWDKEDISVKGLETVKKCEKVFLETYTSKNGCGIDELEKYYGKKIVPASRELVEKNAEQILEPARTKNVAFLVIGDIFAATTHTDLLLRAREQNIKVEFLFNASIINSISITGLEIYKFGITTSIPYPEPNFKPETAYDVIKNNLKLGYHTLVLLDIKTDQERFMTVNEALNILLEIEQKRKQNILTEKTKIIGCARIGQDNLIKYGTVKNLLTLDFGPPLHCIVVPGRLHFIEEEALKQWELTR